MHWGTVVLSLEPIWNLAKDSKILLTNMVTIDDAITFKIGQLETLDNILR